MDTLTHYMISWLIGKRSNLKIDNLRAFLMCSVIPDIDALSILIGYRYFESIHATITHSIFVGIIFAIIITLSLKKIYPGNGNFREMFKFGYAGIIFHNLIDIVFNSNFFLAIETLGVPVSTYFNPPHYLGGNTIFWPISDFKGQLYLHFNYSVLVPFTATILAVIVTYILVFKKIINKEYPWDIWKRQ
jgi:membrane-bound metal-dependent hydrolase YbcI (DUF457 family)